MLSKNIINEVVKEWAWRVPSGMPDINKSKDLNILRMCMKIVHSVVIMFLKNIIVTQL